MKCPTCQEKTNKKYKYCPTCGTKIRGDARVDRYSLRSMEYIWNKEAEGNFIYKNFKTSKAIGRIGISKKQNKIVRNRLSDLSHPHLFNLRRLSFLFVSPDSMPDIYLTGKMLGYYSGLELFRSARLDGLLNTLRKTGVFWKVLENQSISNTYSKAWENAGVGLFEIYELDRTNKKIIYRLRENPSSLVNSTYPSCFMEIAAMCGHAELFFGRYCTGKEVKCESVGDKFSELEIRLKEKEEIPEIKIPKEEFKTMLFKVIDEIISRKKTRRVKLEDNVHIIVDQIPNYLLTSMSQGHFILSKHSGVVCGERIAKKAALESDTTALDYARDLFVYLKAGILHEPESREDHIILRMDESVYSSGVNNINMKLDVFLAGIIEGLLNQATGTKWLVQETKCLANGDDHCQFNCRRPV